MTDAHDRPRWATELLLARARRNVAERAFRAAVGAAAAAGATPGEIADALLVPLRVVEPILDGLGAEGTVVEGPYAVAERYAVGELSREEMRARLVEWTYVPGREMADYWDDAGVTPEGSFSTTVGQAFDDGLIDEEDYDFVVRRHKVEGQGA